MGIQHVIVDGSNIATEGRTAPSLAQLDEAVVSFLEEYGHPALTVVVDATFGHRIDESEREAFEAGIVNGELVTPPAGAIGRGDAFVLQIAAKTEATIFSNDSFQEFHGTYEWLFDEGRLIGGKPVPNVGWVFVPRTPVRGPTSRRATRESRGGSGSGSGSGGSGSGSRSKRGKAVIGSAEASAPMPVPKSPPPGRGSRTRGKASASVAAAAELPVDAAVEIDELETPSTDGGERKSSRSRKRRSSSSKPTKMINEPMPFLAFVSAHPVGSLVEAVVDHFSSHGAYAVADDAQCYIPLKAMADPAPTKAREVLTVGESMTFVVASFDTPRRGIDVAIPGVAPVVDAPPAPDLGDSAAVTESNQPAEEAPSMAVTKKAAAKKAPAKKAPAVKKTAATKTVAKKAPAKAASAKRATPASKAVAKKATAKKATVAKKTVAKKAPVAKKATVTKKATVAKKAPAAKMPMAKKATVAKKAVVKKATVAKKAVAKKATAAKKTVAKKAPAKKAR
jgi:hypothetical protein